MRQIETYVIKTMFSVLTLRVIFFPSMQVKHDLGSVLMVYNMSQLIIRLYIVHGPEALVHDAVDPEHVVHDVVGPKA